MSNDPSMSGYSFDFPEGTFEARLDGKSWGKSSNLRLYFTIANTEARHWLSVWSKDNYAARDGGFSFKTDAKTGERFALTVKHTARGTANLIAARKLVGEAGALPPHPRSI